MVNVQRSGRRTSLEDEVLKKLYLNEIDKYPSHQSLASFEEDNIWIFFFNDSGGERLLVSLFFMVKSMPVCLQIAEG